MGDTGYLECELVAVIVKKGIELPGNGNVHLDGSWIRGLGLGGFFMFWVGKGIFGMYVMCISIAWYMA